jgi:hypothetical protein
MEAFGNTDKTLCKVLCLARGQLRSWEVMATQLGRNTVLILAFGARHGAGLQAAHFRHALRPELIAAGSLGEELELIG